MTREYTSVQFAPDGDWVRDYRESTIQGVWDRVADQGSRWFFYPFPVVVRWHGSVTSRQRIADGRGLPEWWPDFTGRTIASLAAFLRSLPARDIAACNEGWAGRF